MDRERNLERFSSCRGVAFEIQPHVDLFAITPNNSESRRYWQLPWERTSSRIMPSGDLIQRSLSRSSSHFCDLDLDDDNEADKETDSSVYIEEGHGEMPSIIKRLPSDFSLPKGPSKREQKAQKKPNHSRLSVILLDQGLFTVYKRLFVVCITMNIAALVLADTGKFPYAMNKAALFSIANIFTLTLCRSEAILRVVFWLAVKLFGHSWVPVFIKTMVTSLLQSLGGIHSGCGLSSVVWLAYALVLTLRDRDNASPEIIAVASAILALICLSCLAAFPLIRHLHHNVFERTHRFAGWSALALLWVFVVLTISYDSNTKSYCDDIGNRLIKQQEFWFTAAITVLILIPWITVRRVPVKISSPSGHASIIKFQGGMKPGILGRISRSPFSEWHAFGIISDGKDEHMMLAGAVGDFTKSLVAKPPSHLWVRKVHFAGLPYLVNLYDRVLVVATGSGICVFLSFVLQKCKAEVCVLWVAKSVEHNFGNEIKEWMSEHPKERVIVHDTAVLGRPNVSQLSVAAARKWGAQVVIVTSNPEGSRDVVDSCKVAGIPAFGPIWDS